MKLKHSQCDMEFLARFLRGDPPGELVLIEAAKGEDGFAPKGDFVLENHETAQYSKSFAFSSDSKWLASGGSDKLVKIWSVEQRNLHIELTGHTELVSQVAFSPNGKILTSASFDHTVKLWSVPDGKAIATLRGHDKEVRGVAFSPDSNLLVSVSQDGTARLWNTGSGELLGVMDGHGGPMFSVAFAPNGRHFATGSRGQSGVMIWDKNTQKGFIPEVSPQQAREIMSLTFSADGRLLTIVGGWNGFQIWNRKASEAKTIAKETAVNRGLNKPVRNLRVPDYADLQGDWITDSFYIDEDTNSRELQKQGSTALILRTIRVEANELYFRNPPFAGVLPH
jgi:WD40 repeat protein